MRLDNSKSIGCPPDVVTVAPNEKTRYYDAVDDECETGDCSAVSMQVLCEKSLATVNLLTIGDGRRKLETSTITLCTTRVKKGMIKVKSELSVRVGGWIEDLS